VGGGLSLSDGTVLDTLALVDETGRYQWLVAPPQGGAGPDAERQQVSGTLRVSGTALSSTNGISALPPGWVTVQGSTHGLTGLTGQVTERASLAGSFTTVGDQGDTFEGTFSFTYNALYERDSSLAVLEGTYTMVTSTLAIDRRGQLFYQSSGDGRVAAGAAALVDPEYKMYAVSFGVENFAGASAVRNGLAFSGLAFLSDEGGANNSLQWAVSAQAVGGRHVVWRHSARK